MKPKLLLSPLYVLAAGLVAFTAKPAAQTLTNGDFEVPGFTTLVQSANTPGGNDWLWLASPDTANQVWRGYYVADSQLPPGSKFIPGWTIGGNGMAYFRAA